MSLLRRFINCNCNYNIAGISTIQHVCWGIRAAYILWRGHKVPPRPPTPEQRGLSRVLFTNIRYLHSGTYIQVPTFTRAQIPIFQLAMANAIDPTIRTSPNSTHLSLKHTPRPGEKAEPRYGCKPPPSQQYSFLAESNSGEAHQPSANPSK